MQESIDEVVNIQDFVTFIIKYKYDTNTSKINNIKVLIQNINKILLCDRNTKTIELVSEGKNKAIGLDIASWKLEAIFKALKQNMLITTLSIITQELNIEAANSLNDMLKFNKHLTQLTIFDKVGISDDIAQIITEGIRVNVGIKELNFRGNTSSSALNIILRALRDNNSIKYLQIENMRPDNEYIDNLALLIKQNHNIVSLNIPMKTDTSLSRSHITNLFKSLAINNCIEIFNISNEFLYYYDYHSKFGKIIDVFCLNKTLCEFNTDFFKYASDTESSHVTMESNLIRNQAISENIINILNNINLTEEVVKNIRALANYEKLKLNMGTSLLIEKFKTAISIKEGTKIKSLKCDIDLEKKACLAMKCIENYSNDKFFHLKGVTKNICNFLFPQNIWSKIASYCMFEDIPTQSKAAGEIVGVELSGEEQSSIDSIND